LTVFNITNFGKLAIFRINLFLKWRLFWPATLFYFPNLITPLRFSFRHSFQSTFGFLKESFFNFFLFSLSTSWEDVLNKNVFRKVFCTVLWFQLRIPYKSRSLVYHQYLVLTSLGEMLYCLGAITIRVKYSHPCVLHPSPCTQILFAKNRLFIIILSQGIMLCFLGLFFFDYHFTKFFVYLNSNASLHTVSFLCPNDVCFPGTYRHSKVE
jgi:hypothetical protein